MRRLICIIIAFVILLSGSINATEFIVELKASYLNPSEKAFKDIYDGGMMYGGEVSIGVWRSLEVWFGGGLHPKN